MASPRTRRVLQELKPHNENDVSTVTNVFYRKKNLQKHDLFDGSL